MLFSLPHANPMEQSPNQLPQKLLILKYTRHREIEIGLLSDVIYIHRPMLPAKCYCFAVAKTNAAVSLERVRNAQLLCLQARRSALQARREMEIYLNYVGYQRLDTNMLSGSSNVMRRTCVRNH